MRNLLIAGLCGLMALPMASVGDDHGRPSPGHQYSGRYAPPPAHYRGPPAYYRAAPARYVGYRYYPYRAPYAYYGYPYYGHKHHDNDNDDALWAIGGLIVGAAVATAVQKSSAPPPATVSAPAPAATAANCYDDIIHDSSGNPHVERNCYPATTP